MVIKTKAIKFLAESLTEQTAQDMSQGESRARGNRRTTTATQPEASIFGRSTVPAATIVAAAAAAAAAAVAVIAVSRDNYRDRPRVMMMSDG